MTDPSADPNAMAGWCFDPADVRAALDGRRLLNVSLDLSNPCDLNCPYCYIEEKNSDRKVRRPGELSADETRAVLAAFAAAGARTVNLVGAGEPAIDPEFRAVVAEIARLGMTPVVFTNGLRLGRDPGLVAHLDRCGATVVLKYNSADPRTQDVFAGRPGYAAGRDAALAALLAAGFNRPRPTRLGFDTIVVRGNRAELPDLLRYCRRHNVAPLLADLIPTGRTEHGRFAGHAALARLPQPARDEAADLLQPLSPADRADLYARLRAADGAEFGVRHPPAPAYYSGLGCTQVLGLYVDVRGDVWPCVARARRAAGRWSSEPLGNVRRGADLLALWRQPGWMQELRAGYTGGCPYKPRLGAPVAPAAAPEPQPQPQPRPRGEARVSLAVLP